ncbi:hypothetical protein PRIPAC_84485, partial [Pristionchus pacificus]|uniref:Uncharacterized protein n=1 Tax=Pristionchus pacificus TaxID=54126 RepID=A0A2A6BST5_PRIPA
QQLKTIDILQYPIPFPCNAQTTTSETNIILFIYSRVVLNGEVLSANHAVSLEPLAAELLGGTVGGVGPLDGDAVVVRVLVEHTGRGVHTESLHVGGLESPSNAASGRVGHLKRIRAQATVISEREVKDKSVLYPSQVGGACGFYLCNDLLDRGTTGAPLNPIKIANRGECLNMCANLGKPRQEVPASKIVLDGEVLSANHAVSLEPLAAKLLGGTVGGVGPLDGDAVVAKASQETAMRAFSLGSSTPAAGSTSLHICGLESPSNTASGRGALKTILVPGWVAISPGGTDWAMSTKS